MHGVCQTSEGLEHLVLVGGGMKAQSLILYFCLNQYFEEIALNCVHVLRDLQPNFRVVILGFLAHQQQMVQQFALGSVQR